MEPTGKRAAPWPAAENASKVAKTGHLATAKTQVAAAKAPLQPIGPVNADAAPTRMPPPPPKKPLTDDRASQVQVRLFSGLTPPTPLFLVPHPSAS